jgi:hypothetical protein
MIALLALTLVDIERQRRIAARQEARVESLAGTARPELTRLREGLAKAQPGVRSGLRRADRLVRALLDHRGPSAIAAAGELARDLTAGNRAAGLIDRGTDLLVSLRRTDAVGDIDALTRLSAELLGVTQDLATIGRATRDDAEVLRVQTIRFKKRSLRIQRSTLRILRRSLAVQEETLVHARRIDDRLGGALDPTSGTAPAG